CAQCGRSPAGGAAVRRARRGARGPAAGACPALLNAGAAGKPPRMTGSPLSGRDSGILLHPTSLPGPHGIGELGAAAHRFLDYLLSAGQTLWQVLPLGPTGYGDSPYACFSSFAGNPLLISLDTLVEWGALDPRDLAGTPEFARDRVDFGALITWKMPLLRKAAARFLDGRFLDSKGGESRKEFESFVARE